MAAGRSAANTKSHCLTISNITDKGKNICNIVGPGVPFRTNSPR
jgi:hypothetical protein